jgi:GR25 family glycosyltransferase involved in LPS biosynthesis
MVRYIVRTGGKMISLNDFFDHIYCINLDERKDRWKSATEQFEKNNITVERISGIKNKFSINKKVNDGEMGLILTHKLIYIDAIKNNYKNILILEDDIIFADDFSKKFNDAALEIPKDWDLFYLGGFYWLSRPKEFLKNISIADNILCAHAIGINVNILETMLSLINFSEPIDVTYANKQKDLKSYITSKTLIGQKRGFKSNVQPGSPNINIDPFFWDTY